MKFFDKFLKAIDEFVQRFKTPFDENPTEVYINRDFTGSIRIFMGEHIQIYPASGGFYSYEAAQKTAELNGYKVISKKEYFKKYINKEG